jgi:hypothetical protein
MSARHSPDDRLKPVAVGGAPSPDDRLKPAAGEAPGFSRSPGVERRA